MSLKKIMGASLAALALSGVFALAVQAEDSNTNVNTNTSTNTNAPLFHHMTKPQVDLTCMVTGVDKREAAIASAFSTFTGAMQSALSARATALHAAWGMTDAQARRAAIRAAWSTFRTAKRTARANYNTAIKAAWSTFRADAKACHGSTSDEGASQGQDNL